MSGHSAANAPILALLKLPLRGQGGMLLVASSIGIYVILVLYDVTATSAEARWIVMMFASVFAIIALGCFLLYAWLALQHAAEGHLDPIASIDVDAVHPFFNYLGLQVAALSMVFVAFVDAAFDVSAVLATALIAGGALVLPAMLGVMILERRFLAGLDPAHVTGFVRHLGGAYVAFALSLYVGMAALLVACMTAPNYLVVLAASYGFVLGHMGAGYVLFRHRGHGGRTVSVRAVKSDDEAAVRIEALMVELHRLCGVDRIVDADRRLEAFLSIDAFALDDRLHRRLAEFHDPRLILAHGWHFFDRLLAAGKIAFAWRLLRECLALDARFRPRSASDLLRVIAVAPLDAPQVIDVLRDFERAYPGNAELPQARLELARRLPAIPEQLK